MEEANVIELVQFKKKSQFTDEELIQAGEAVNEILSDFPGYMTRKQAKANSNEWIDIVHWKNMECAVNASKEVMSIEICLNYFSMIEDETVQLKHFNLSINHKKLNLS